MDKEQYRIEQEQTRTEEIDARCGYLWDIIIEGAKEKDYRKVITSLYRIKWLTKKLTSGK